MTKKTKILIVDDDSALRITLSDILNEKGYLPQDVATGREALEKIVEENPAVALIDIKLEDISGLDVMRGIKEIYPDTECILITGHASRASAIEAINLGAYSYIVKPYNMEQLLLTVQRAIEKRVANDALRDSEEKYRTILEEMEEGYYEVDLAGNFTFFNDSMLRIRGYSKDEFTGMNYKEYMDEATASRIYNAYNKVYTTGRPVKGLEWKIKRNDGTKGYVEASISLNRNSKGIPIGFRGVVRDVTERKIAEEERMRLEDQLKQAQKMAGIGYWTYDPQTQMPTWTEEVYHLFGLDPSQGEVSYEEHRQVIHPDDWQTFDDAVTRLLNEGKSYDLFLRSVHKDGSIIHYNTKGFAIFGEDGCVESLYGVCQDITAQKKAAEEREQLQDQLHRAQKMEAMGLMAGGVAHDLNNILSGIVSYPELLLMDLSEDSPLRKPIETIKESGMKAADVVEDLLTIARGVATGKEVLNLNTIVAEYLESAEYEKLEKTRSFVNLKTELDTDLLNMSGSSTHIKKTLMNLAVNASEAIEGTGTVTISTMNRYLDEPLKGYTGIRIGEYAVLSVSDDGFGITPKDLEKIFEPFYTKKIMGRSGTGLGLAVVWNTVQDHKGYINVESSEKGTVFELYFPVSREEVAAEKNEIPLDGYLGHRERILVVDDEERQREIACGILTKLGYNPEAVSSGEEAIEYMKENTVDLIVLDMVMPKGINGRETYEQIIKIHPGQKAVIASGYAKTREVDTAQELGAGKYIKKPYTLEKIGVAVKEELEK